ncbi:MAG: radical SAM protein [bacterium]
MIFINPFAYYSYRSPSIGMLYIAAWLRRNESPASYLDCNYRRNWDSLLKTRLKEHTTAGITANVLTIAPALHVARRIRENSPSTRIVMGGPYPSVEYEKLVPEFADVVVIGEGEETALELAKETPLENVRGIAYSDSGPGAGDRAPGNPGFKVNPPRSLIRDLDGLPFPAWDMGDVKKYYVPHTRRPPVLPMITSRGCPFHCIYCGSNIIHKGRLRYRSVENVIAEVDEVYHRYGVREIHFWDDNFTLPPARAMEICDRIAERRYRDLHLAVPAGIRPDIGNDELFQKMARAGFYKVAVAVETGDQEIMDKIGKKIDLSKVKDTILAIRRAGIYTSGFFMLGLPFDTVKTMEKTIAFACSLPLNQAQFFLTVPFPGTELHAMVKREGRFIYQVDGRFWNKGYFLGKASYEMPGFSAATLERMYRLAYRRFFLRPSQILRVAPGRMRSPRDLFYVSIKALSVILKGRGA